MGPVWAEALLAGSVLWPEWPQDTTSVPHLLPDLK